MTDRWQPIETAPKDSPILSWDGSSYGCVVWYSCRRKWRLIEERDNRPCAESDEWEGITHWMPLPDPPADTGETR